ncbi:MAG: phosphoglycerate dehydrogenase [Planctomycetia bacterium]|nr:phosphoglycerate dehydrogenase [Planctomycetia bacterium]
MKILVTPTSFLKPQNAEARRLLEAFADEIVYNDLGVPLKESEILSRLNNVDGYIAGLDYITTDVVRQMPESLKVISRYGVGVERVDIKECTQRGIKVTNTPGANSVAVCELAFGLMIAAARNITRLHQTVEHSQWVRNEGVELCGKTLGIVGLGAIGKKLAIRAIAFGMNVIAYDPCFDMDFAKQFRIAEKRLDGIFAESDFISLHVPLNDKTHHMINEKSITKMRPGIVIINTARGGIIDEAAVAVALKSGKIGGIGLDAFEEEPLKDSPLIGLDNVVLTPHTGAHTGEAVQTMGTMAVKNLINVLSGHPCPFLMN